MNTVAYTITQIGFVAITAIYFGLLFREFRNGALQSSLDAIQRKKFLKGIVGTFIIWISFISFWSLSGRMSNFEIFPFNVMPILILPMVGILLLIFSKTFKEILVLIPPQNIIRLQSFRVFVEILLWALFIQNLAPRQMTFEGRNFDVISGLTALPIAWFASRRKLSKAAIVVWNLVCLGLLVNIVIVAIMSMPTPLRTFMNEPANTIVAVFPISWLPGVLVPLAYGLHFLSLRQLALLEKVVKPAN
jgi:hypothetical protein